MAPHPWLSVGAQNLIRKIHASETQALDFFQPGGWWIENDRTSGRYAHELLTLCLLRLADGKLGSGHELYELSQDALGVLNNGETPLFVLAMRENRGKT